MNGKNIVVGISGGIAAYKTIELIRLLRKANANVRVVLTPAAAEFVTPLTLQAISGNAVAQSLLDPQAELAMGHIELAKWADAIVIAPASADLIARLNAGMANDLLSTICLATQAPIFLAPAMNQQMFRQTITQQNIQSLLSRGFKTIGPNSGFQACGDMGAGRMSEPQEIFAALSMRGALNIPNLSLVLKHHAAPLSWAEILPMLRKYAALENRHDSGFYHVARIKQWLQYLKCEYAQAVGLFEVVKRCDDAARLRILLDSYEG